MKKSLCVLKTFLCVLKTFAKIAAATAVVSAVFIGGVYLMIKTLDTWAEFIRSFEIMPKYSLIEFLIFMSPMVLIGAIVVTAISVSEGKCCKSKPEAQKKQKKGKK